MIVKPVFRWWAIALLFSACEDSGTGGGAGAGGDGAGGAQDGADAAVEGGAGGSAASGGTGAGGGVIAGASGGTAGAGGGQGGSVGGQGGRQPDGGVLSDAGQNGPVPQRLIVVSTTNGIYRDALKVVAPGQSDSAGWTVDLKPSNVTLSPVLTPLANFRNRLLVIDGLTVHVSMGDGTDCYPTTTTVAALTGDFECTDLPRSPSLDFLIAKSLSATLPLFKIGTGTSLSFNDTGGKLPANTTPRGAYDQIFPASGTACGEEARPAAAQPTSLGAWMGQMIPIVTAALRCDRARVVTMTLPQPDATELEFAGDFRQDIAHVVGGALQQGMTPPENARTVFTRFNAITTTQIARLATALDAVPEGAGTMLDHTLILWISDEGTPGYGRHPWNAIFLGSASVGVPSGRYVRVPQNVVTAEPYMTGTTMLGTSHNHLLVSLSRWMGRPTNSVGLSSLPQMRGAPTLDLTGPLPGF